MRTFTFAAIAASTLFATATLAQDLFEPRVGVMPGVYKEGNPEAGSGISAINGMTSGVLASTPSRMERSRRTMNTGRSMAWGHRPTPMQLRRQASNAIARGGLNCTIRDLDLVAQLADGTPLIEVACEEGGVVLANSTPVQATDCLDLIEGRGNLGPCRIASNVAMVEASRQSATN